MKNIKELGAAIVDIVAIVGLCTLAALHVISGEAIVPVVILIAGANVGTNMQRARDARATQQGQSITPPPSGGGSAVVIGIVSSVLHALKGMGK